MTLTSRDKLTIAAKTFALMLALSPIYAALGFAMFSLFEAVARGPIDVTTTATLVALAVLAVMVEMGIRIYRIGAEDTSEQMDRLNRSDSA